MTNHPFSSGLIPAILLSAFAAAYAPCHTIRAQAVPSTTKILRLDSSGFPEIRLQIRLFDPKGYDVQGVSPAGLSVTEDGRRVEFQMEERETGAEIAFVLDAGMGLYAGGATGESRLEEMKQAVLEIVEDPVLMDGMSAFHILVQEPDGCQVLADPATPATRIRSILEQYRPQAPDRLAAPLEGVGGLLDRFEKADADDAVRSKAVVLLSGSLQTGRGPSLLDTAAKAGRLGIPIHSVLVREGFEFGESMQALSRRSGGAFYYYDTAGPAALSDLKARLAAMRRQYFLSYRSPSAGSDSRVVSVAVASGGTGKPALEQYSLKIEPPMVKIISPAGNQTASLQPVSTPGAPDSPTNAPAEQPSAAGILVSGSVSWPDGHARRIRRAVLLVDGNPQTILDSPGDALTFVWIPAAEAGSPSSSFRLQIQAEDELGLKAASDPVEVRIESGWLSAVCPPGSASFPCAGQITDLVPYASLAIAVAALALVVFFRRQVAVTAQKAAGAATEFMQEIGETVRFRTLRGRGRAQLIDMDGGSGWPQGAVTVAGTTAIGRSRRAAAVVLHTEREDSPISRLHCTIAAEDGGFSLRDEQSANGTYLNGMRLAPLENHPLKDGDEIRLGSPERGGFRILFRLAQEARPAEDAGAEKTRWMKRG